ncbi:MAG: acyltransferase family protein [Luteimonas sp.]
MQRRHDIDALRALAFALLILYHWGMFYVAGDDWGWHVKSTHLAGWLQLPMLAVNRWRMDLVFLVSGLSVNFMLKDSAIGRFVAQRSWRLLLPLVFGMWVVVPIQPYAEGVSNGLVQPGFLAFLARYYGHTQWPQGAFAGWEHGFTWNHLWYLAYLWTYTLVLVALLPLLRRRAGLHLRLAFTSLRGPWLVLLPALPLAVATFALQSRFPDTGDLVHDWYRHAIYFTAFLYGYWIGTDAGIWDELARLRRRTLAFAAGLFALYFVFVVILPDDVPGWLERSVWLLRNLYLWSALCAILGFARAHLDKPWPWLRWANESVYPWYMLHQSFIVGIGFLLLPLGLGPVTEPALVLLGTVAGCWLLNDLLIRRSGILRPLFGLKGRPRREAAAVAQPA